VQFAGIGQRANIMVLPVVMGAKGSFGGALGKITHILAGEFWI
jgi:hypothetical protein